MGRKPTRNLNLPAGMRARHRGKKTYYFLDTGAKPRKEIPLGIDYVVAVQKWAELTVSAEPKRDLTTFRYAAEKYCREVLPTKALRTQKDNLKELANLYKFFDEPPVPLDDIEPVNIRQYLDWRGQTAKVRANREKALFSHIFNFAREAGLTSNPNPCKGVKGFKEEGRDVFVDDALFKKLIDKSCRPLQFALRLAYLTGQRPADVYKMAETDVKDGVLWIKQGKTKAPLRIEVTGELKTLLDEIFEYKRQFSVRPLALLVTEKGQPMNEYTLRTRIDKARESAGIAKQDLQFRDMRPKAATEVDSRGGTREAQALLGHTTETMTTQYIRHKVGKLVKPTK